MYEFTEGMGEISGFGGGYEECCRVMLKAALEWMDVHPDANPRYSSLENVFGLLRSEEEAAKKMDRAMMDAAVREFGERGAPTGAMHHAVVLLALWIKAHGWDAFVKARKHANAGKVTE